MKQKNIYKQNERYFTEGEGIKILGATLVGLAVAIFFFGWGYLAYILMSVSAPLGVFLFFFGASRRASDADIEQYIALATEGIETVSENERVWLKRLDKSFSPLSVAGYSYDGDILLARAKNGTVRSTAYEKSVLYVLKDALYISSRRISLVAEKKENETRELPFSEIVKMEIVTNERHLVCEKKTYLVKDTRLCIHLAGGDVISLPTSDDLIVEEFIERILRNLQKLKSSEA
jgi:hypothetical protein